MNRHLFELLRRIEEGARRLASNITSSGDKPLHEMPLVQAYSMSDNQQQFTGSYNTWDEAARDSTGYDQANILQKTLEATLAVREGRAVSCRDSVILDKIEHNWPLIATLLWAALGTTYLSVADFGGALGCSYFDCRSFLRASYFLWTVVEQPGHVAAGNKHLANGELNFAESIEAMRLRPNVIIASGVLQCLRDPWATLRALSRVGADYLFIDRTTFKTGPDRLTVQHVPEWIYKATYPLWFLSREKFDAWLEDSPYEMIAEFKALDWVELEGEQVSALGFILRRLK
jgi:putative methyltransferase (TIGR04325 family)